MVKPELVDTCMPYETAPLEAFHSSLGVRLDTVEALAGDFNVGADGGGPIIVKSALLVSV
jgi:hypothetical protein